MDGAEDRFEAFGRESSEGRSESPKTLHSRTEKPGENFERE